ncbi:MAG: putative polymerase subfamily sigma factor [Marmoricola sp.]|jgi:RNA polymerase sigma-70 factor (sigma-E family)|nr:putative polymerase subfamily sigma factor [Marmoricola sp.]
MAEAPSLDEQPPGSFEEFVHATGPRMYRTAVLLCGDHHLAEDLTQATYAKVFASWGRVRRADNPVAYTRTVLTRTWLSHRRLRRTTEQPVDDLPDLPAPHPDPGTRLDLVEALSRLRPEDRAVVVLRFYLDLSVNQTAQLLGISDVATRKRCSRALERLRSMLPDLDLEASS